MTSNGRNTTGHGYIYIPNWDRFQHYKDRRPAWIKNYVDLLENEDYLDLGAADRALLECIWKWTAVCGNGRVPARVTTLRRRFRLRHCNLERLTEAGFIEVRASKALATCYQPDSAEKEKEVSNETKSAASSARRNGALTAHKKQLANAIAGARSLVDGEPPHIAEQTIREAYDDDLVPGILAALLNPASKELT